MSIETQCFLVFVGGFESLPLRQKEKPGSSMLPGFFLLLQGIDGFSFYFNNETAVLFLIAEYQISKDKCSRKCSRRVTLMPDFGSVWKSLYSFKNFFEILLTIRHYWRIIKSSRGTNKEVAV